MRVSQRTLASMACASFLSLSLAVTAAEPNAEEQTERYPQQEALIDALSGQFSNFYALTEYPNTVGDYPPLVYTGTPLTLPNGHHGVLVSQYHFDVSGSAQAVSNNPVRQQLYAFINPGEAADAVHVTYPVPTDLTAAQLSQADTFSQLQRLPGCETYWTAPAETNETQHFEGYKNPKRCYFMNPEQQSQVHVESIHYVTAQEQKLTENLLNAKGEPLADMALAGTLVLHPIRFFQVQAAYLPEGANEENNDAWVHIEPASNVHDHGQRINLLTQNSQQLIPYQIRVLRHQSTPQQVRVSLYSLGEHTALEEVDISIEEANGTFKLGPLRLSLTLAASER